MSSARVIRVVAWPWVLAVPFCLLSCGCAGFLKQGPVAKAYFAIEVGNPPGASMSKATTRPNRPVLQIRTLQVAPPYDGALFVYRTGPSQFDTDFYNNFIAPPASLLTGDLVEWLSNAGTFTVSGPEGDLPHNFVLQGNVTALYIDSTASPQRAVITGRFFLTQERNNGPELIMEKPYEGSAPVAGKAAADFAGAWGQAYRQMLIQLSDDLTQATRGR